MLTPPIESPPKRRKLPERKEPYFRQISRGVSLGYYKGAQSTAWISRRMVDGRRQLVRLGTPNDTLPADGVAVLTYSQAVEKAQAVRAGPVRQPGSYSVRQAVEDYLEHYRAEGKAIADTENTYAAHILPEFGRLAVSDLTAERIKRWRDRLATEPVRRRQGRKSRAPGKHPSEEAAPRRTRSRATVNRLLTALKAALNHAWNEGRVSCDPVWRKVKPFRMADRPRVRWLKPEEVKRLVNKAEPDFRPMVQAAVLTGCRYGELCRLTVADYYPGKHATIHVQESKGADRYVPLTSDGAELFETLTAGRQASGLVFARADGEAWGDGHQHRRMREASKLAKIDPPAAFHTLRHCYGSWLASAGVPLQVIAKAMGHSSVAVTEKYYAHLAPDYVADQVRAHLPRLGIKGKVRALR